MQLEKGDGETWSRYRWSMTYRVTCRTTILYSIGSIKPSIRYVIEEFYTEAQRHRIADDLSRNIDKERVVSDRKYTGPFYRVVTSSVQHNTS